MRISKIICTAACVAFVVALLVCWGCDGFGALGTGSASDPGNTANANENAPDPPSAGPDTTGGGTSGPPDPPSGTGDATVTVEATLQLPATGQTTNYAAGDDGEYQAGQGLAAAVRFEDLGDGTIMDHQTGLMWLQDASCLIRNYPEWETDGWADGWVPWEDALRFVADINGGAAPACAAGYSDWRLANVNELESLCDAGQSPLNEWLMSVGFQFVEANSYWTSTTDVATPDTFAYVVDLSDGAVSKLGNKGSVINSVLPVRGSSDSDTPVWKTGQTITYVAGDDGEHRTGVAWPDPRFTNNGDGTVTDHLTGLMWLRNADALGGGTWTEALGLAGRMNDDPSQFDLPGYAATYTDWRVPNRKEIQSLFDYSQSDPALPPGHPFIGVSATDSYWTSTTYANDTLRAWEGDLRDGDIGYDLKVNGHRVILVR